MSWLEISSYLTCVSVSIQDLPDCGRKLTGDRLVLFFQAERNWNQRRRKKGRSTQLHHGRHQHNLPPVGAVLTGQVGFAEPLGAAQVVRVWVHVLVQQQSGLLLCSQGRVVQTTHQQSVSTWWNQQQGWGDAYSTAGTGSRTLHLWGVELTLGCSSFRILSNCTVLSYFHTFCFNHTAIKTFGSFQLRLLEF